MSTDPNEAEVFSKRTEGEPAESSLSREHELPRELIEVVPVGEGIFLEALLSQLPIRFQPLILRQLVPECCCCCCCCCSETVAHQPPAARREPAPMPGPGVTLASLSVDLDPVQLTSLVVGGSLLLAFTLSWHASGGPGLNVSIEIERPGFYSWSPLPGAQHLPVPQNDVYVWRPTYNPGPPLWFRAVARDNSGGVAYSQTSKI